jgi:hypothetical protein
MGNSEFSYDLKVKIEQIKSNLKSWTFLEWIFFIIIIPALLLLTYTFPQDVKNQYFILNTSELWRLQTYFLNAYIHSQLFPHLFSNIIYYVITILAIFSLENNKLRFWVMSGCSLILIPIVTSIFTLVFSHILGINANSQGFSAINSALIAYAFLIFVIWSIGDNMKIFDHPELFTKSKIFYYILCGLLAFMLSMIVWVGIVLGQFMNMEGSTSNGLAHFGGFVLGLITFLIFSITIERRTYFNGILGIAIAVGIFWYGNYLIQIIKTVKGGYF